ncbi:MAG: pyridoxamine 5'-phosphate oxidase family protein [Treponema succinifaciens]|uniref:pyridoxamine 5'-phosphate oxidase family protein n=1 Tax=Treponema succinifaciens TaxID=167 RepID=UPI002355A2C9|nr:pyridoxamine 5'-phosphate oxidase family protein [Treponema succinifaciens]MCI6912413.1 pyridoxamine 5'-phosphate oxidase family protein [Treponema succinifaciens]
MRRKEREITDFEEIIKILDESNFLTLAMIKGTEPYSVPVNFGYKLDGDRKMIQIFIHGATEGTKLNCIKDCPRVSFSAVSYSEIGANKEPCGWTDFYRSVCGKGNASILEDADEKKRRTNLYPKKIWVQRSVCFSCYYDEKNKHDKN